MEFTKLDVEKIGKLARIAVSEEEVARFSSEFSSIINYVKELDELNLAEVEPVIGSASHKNAFRDDEVTREEGENVRNRFLDCAVERTTTHITTLSPLRPSKKSILAQ